MAALGRNGARAAATGRLKLRTRGAWGKDGVVERQLSRHIPALTALQTEGDYASRATKESSLLSVTFRVGVVTSALQSDPITQVCLLFRL